MTQHLEGIRHFTPEEFEALAHRWPNLPEPVREDYLGQMNRAQRKRFERTVASMHEAQQLYASKMMNRQDMANTLGLYTQQVIFPIGARLEAVENWIAYQQKPWHKRARLTLRAWWAKALAWLDEHGIGFVTLDEEAGTVPGPETPGAQDPPPAVSTPSPSSSSAIEVVRR